MPTLSSLSSPFKETVESEEETLLDAEDMLEEDEEGKSDGSGLSTWKEVESDFDDNPQDNGGGLSEWKTKRKRNGLKGRTPKHPLNKRPYTC